MAGRESTLEDLRDRHVRLDESTRVEPGREGTIRYQEMYRRYLALNNALADWFEETGFLLNMATGFVTLGLALAARIRREPHWPASVASIVLAAPSLWLSAKFIKAIVSFATHGDM
jgi:hypothetical protein